MNMLVYFLLIIILCYSQLGLLTLATVIPQTKNVKWYVKYMSSIDGEPTHAINEVGFDRHRFETNVEDSLCTNPLAWVDSLANSSGYVFCTDIHKGIVQRCPSDTVVSFKVGGCVNRTTNQTILPIGSRCASQPCQNGGRCYDFPSADGFLCSCSYPYEGVHCHARTRVCSSYICGTRDFEGSLPSCISFASDRALRYICYCLTGNVSYYTSFDCEKGERYYLKCDENVSSVSAVPFTNKAYLVCKVGSIGPFIRSCRVGHVWNDTQKECVQE